MQPNPQDLPIPSDFASPKEEEFEILVKGLPPDTTDIQLAEVFGEVGPVLKVRLVASNSGYSSTNHSGQSCMFVDRPQIP